MSERKRVCCNCNDKCPQEQLANEIAKGRMYATNELVRCYKEIQCNVLEDLIGCIEELEQYRAIGTVEEFKDLKEKSVAKKPEPIDYEKYMDVLENAKFLRGAYWCPNCKHTVRSGTYCDDCGQKLDWQ